MHKIITFFLNKVQVLDRWLMADGWSCESKQVYTEFSASSYYGVRIPYTEQLVRPLKMFTFLSLCWAILPHSLPYNDLDSAPVELSSCPQSLGFINWEALSLAEAPFPVSNTLNILMFWFQENKFFVFKNFHQREVCETPWPLICKGAVLYSWRHGTRHSPLLPGIVMRLNNTLVNSHTCRGDVARQSGSPWQPWWERVFQLPQLGFWCWLFWYQQGKYPANTKTFREDKVGMFLECFHGKFS